MGHRLARGGEGEGEGAKVRRGRVNGGKKGGEGAVRGRGGSKKAQGWGGMGECQLPARIWALTAERYGPRQCYLMEC